MFKTSPLVPLGLGLLLVACENPTAPEPDAALGPTDASSAELNTWSTKASILAARVFGVAGAQNNIIYFVGGKDAGGNAVKTVMAYTIATNSWAFKASLPKNRSSANGASFLNGKLYVSGGMSNTGGASKSLYEYNPATNTWTQKANMPVESACGAQGVINDRLYVYAPGIGSCGAQHRFYRYNPNNDTWTSLPTPPSRHLSPVAGVIGGKFYLAGGTIDGSLNPNYALHVYTPGTNSWSAKASLPGRHQNAAGAALGGKLYLAGGIDFFSPGAPAIATVRAYDPGTNTWSLRASLPTARHYAAGINAGSKLWVISGFGGGYSTKNEAYTP